MPLYEMTSDAFRPLDKASLAELKVRERDDLQRLLRTQINVLADDLYVLAEEFSEWEDSHRRIDLLAIDLEANLVVIELKRTTDGGHMELQAIRYASMVSAMTFKRAVEVHGDFLKSIGEPSGRSEDRILEFLGWSEPDEKQFGANVRIVLASEDFGKELTTAVLWLRERDIDIRCIRLCSYKDGDSHLIDVQPIIPLPEADEYQIRIREKTQEGKKIQAERNVIRLRFWEGLVALAQKNNTRHGNRKPSGHHWLGAQVNGYGLNYVIGKNHATIELYIDKGDDEFNKRIFDALHAKKEQIEQAYGGEFIWEPLKDKRACRIKDELNRGGYRNPDTDWPAIQQEMLEKMTRLEAAFLPQVEALKL